MEKPVLYIVVPCYNEEEVLEETNRQLCALLGTMMAEGQVSAESRLLYVDDGSRDATWSLIERFHGQTAMVCGVKLAANSGHQRALLAGLYASKSHSDIMVSIDADLQDDIGVIPDMVSAYARGCDVVYGVRRRRTTDTFFKRFTAQSFYRVMGFLGVKTVYNHADFRLMSRRAVEELFRYKERNLFLRGLVPLIGYPSDVVYYDRKERLAGESKYPLRKMLSFAAEGITSFSVQPLHLLLYLGAIFILVSLLIFCYVIYRYITHDVVPGWASLILSVWFVGGCVLVGLGIVGEYVGKIYIEAKGRPRFNIEQELL